MNLTNNFPLEDFFVSKDFPDEAALAYEELFDPRYSHKISDVNGQGVTTSLFHLCYMILQRARDKFGVPIIILSGFRDKDLNEKEGGSENSRHMLGLAADITVRDPAMLKEIYNWIEAHHSNQLGELIYYKDRNFIHIALPRHGANNNKFEVR